MKRIILVTTLLFLILIAAVVNGWALSVQGHVADETKDVKYKQVYIGDYDGQTDGSGNFVIWIDPGKYIVSVNGYNETWIGGINKTDQAIRFRPGQDKYLSIIVKD